MKTIRVQVSDDTYSELMAVQGHQQTYLGERSTLARAVAVAVRIAAASLSDPSNGAEHMLDDEQ